MLVGGVWLEGGVTMGAQSYMQGEFLLGAQAHCL